MRKAAFFADRHHASFKLAKANVPNWITCFYKDITCLYRAMDPDENNECVKCCWGHGLRSKVSCNIAWAKYIWFMCWGAPCQPFSDLQTRYHPTKHPLFWVQMDATIRALFYTRPLCWFQEQVKPFLTKMEQSGQTYLQQWLEKVMAIKESCGKRAYYFRAIILKMQVFYNVVRERPAGV